MWSKWQWVTRIASTFPISPAAARMRSASSPGSTTRTRSEPWRRSRKQFSAIAPTVSISTSRPTGRCLFFPRANSGPLAPPPHRHVDEVAGGDVEGEHDGGDEAADDRAAPGRRQVAPLGRFALGAGAGFRLGAGAGFGAAGIGVDAPALGAALLAAALLLGLGHGVNLVGRGRQPPLDQVLCRVEAAQRH